MEDPIGDLTRDHRRRRVGAERDLLHVVDREMATADQHILERERASAARRVDADLLAFDVGAAGFLRIGRADRPIGIGQAIDADDIGIGIGDLADGERGRHEREVDVADDRARAGGAAVELPQLDIGVVLLEEALLVRRRRQRPSDRSAARPARPAPLSAHRPPVPAARGHESGRGQQRGCNDCLAKHR